MSNPSKTELLCNAGFVLVEVLAALSIAFLLFVVLSQGFRMAWSRAQRPAETTWAMALARNAALSVRDGADANSDDIDNFRYETEIEPLMIEQLESALPPAPITLSSGTDEPAETKARPGLLQLIVVSVTAPSGHQYRYETIRLKLAQDEK
jgi:type II secretory pathway pseudopilin PulG